MQNDSINKPLSSQSTGASSQDLGSRNPFKRFLTEETLETTEPANIPIPESSGNGLSANANSRPSSSRTLSKGALNSPHDLDMSSLTLEDSSSVHYAPPQGPPPGQRSRYDETSSQSPLPARAQPPRLATIDILTEELPPSYTPGPNTLMGEQSVDFGPARPFQNVGPQQQNLLSGRPGFSSTNGQYGRNTGYVTVGSTTLGNLLVELLTGTGSNYRSTAGTTRQQQQPTPYLTPQTTRPPALIPAPSNTYQGWSSYPGRRPRSAPSSPSELPADDGRPTPRPVPGHPLLKSGNVLVYPVGYECGKCHNKGYKPISSHYSSLPRAIRPGDPSKECHRCWRRFARPYGTELMNANWGNAEAETNYQRPISDAPSAPSPTTRPLSIAPVQFPITAQQSRAAPPELRFVRNPPPNATVLSPGDARIGGRPCFRCNGSGRIPVFIFDTERCPSCKGLGRVF